MWFLIGEIVLYLVIAAVIGLVVGWSLGRSGRAPTAVGTGDEADGSELAETLSERDAEIELLRAELAPYQTDDLKLINGVGPVFERTLNAMGYTTYTHVAGWTRDDIRDVAAEIDLFPDRIINDQWVEQAAALMKNGPVPEFVDGESDDDADPVTDDVESG